MGKRTRSRRKGSGRRKAISHRAKGKATYGKGTGLILDMINDPSRNPPLMKVRFKEQEKLMIPPEGVQTGEEIQIQEGEVKPGNVLSLKKIPEGVPIFNIEGIPGDGGKFARSSGGFGFIRTKERNSCIVKLPSKKIRKFDLRCLATIGIVAGGGRKEKPFVKAGKKFKAMKSRGKMYPVVSGVSMNPLDHPFGGSTKPGVSKTVSRHAPPGAKVGSFGAKRTGRKKR
jgi:large subunit ribosomal protein L2